MSLYAEGVRVAENCREASRILDEARDGIVREPPPRKRRTMKTRMTREPVRPHRDGDTDG